MKKVILTIMIFTIVAVAIKFSINKKINLDVNNCNLNENIYNFLQSEENRKSIYSKAIKLNNGSSANTCVYFLAELLRKNNFMVPSQTKNISEILNILKEDGWEKDGNYEKLKSGDICFTTDGDGNKNGIPTHTYIFMKWVKEGNYDYAYICDNQAKDYKGKLYHIRNLKIVDKINGSKKDAFAFVMRKS